MDIEVNTLFPGDRKTYPKKGDTVILRYVAKLENGKVFENSSDQGKLFEAKIGSGKLIQGLDEGLMKVSKWEKARITISPNYGYGAEGLPGVVPPNSVLVYEVEMINIRH